MDGDSATDLDNLPLLWPTDDHPWITVYMDK